MVKFDRALGLESYNNNRVAGRFIIIDKYTNATLGAGMIVEVLEGFESSANKADSKRTYTPQEIALNAYIREFYPEWECREI